jgi:uncharacterized membrane protein YagU involved in acid resistance
MNIWQSVLANLAATIVLSILMVAKSMMGLMPQLDVIAMLSAMMNGPAALGWAGHFMIGTVIFGIAFALLRRYLPGKTNLFKGIVFGVSAWAMMMIAVMPMAGAGFCGLNLGIVAPVMTLMLHVIYGAVLGLTFDKLTSRSATTQAHASA